MMIEYLAIVLFTLLVIGYIVFVYKPKKRLLWYKKVYEALGYKVKTYQFKLFKIGIFSEWAYCRQKYGDILYNMKQEDVIQCDVILCNVLNRIQITLLNPQLMKCWLTSDTIQKYQKHPLFVQNLVRLAGGPGLLFSQGENWKKKRKITTKLFTHELLIANMPKMSEIFDQVFDQLEDEYKKNHPDKGNQIELNIGDAFAFVFSKVMLQIFFGDKAKKRQVHGQDLSVFFLNLVGDINLQSGQSTLGLILGRWYHNLGVTSFDRAINKKIKIMKAIAKEIIQQQIEFIKENGFSQKPTTITQAFLKQQFQQKKSKQFLEKYDPNELIQDFHIIFMAGTDTTTNFTKSMVYYLGKNPQVFQRLKKQVKLYDQKQGSELSWEKLKKIEYIDWIQNQLIRLCGPANTVFLRLAQEDNYISKLEVKKGDVVTYSSVPSHYNPKIYNNPTQFRPQRWQKQCDKIHPYAFVGFSSGRRSCVGKNLALLESKVALMKFIRRYKSINLHGNQLKIQMRLAFQVVDFPITLQKNV